MEIADHATTVLKFCPFSSALNAGFWYTLSKYKLEVYGLDESPKSLNGFYSNGDLTNSPSWLNLDHTAFDSEFQTPPRCFKAYGLLINKNTIESFKNCDKQEILNNQSTQIWDSIESGQVLNDVSLLTRFTLLTFADLKKYIYYYWFCFPCLSPEQKIMMTKSAVKVPSRLNENQLYELHKGYSQLKCKSFFLFTENNGQVDELANLSSYTSTHNLMFGFSDPSTLEFDPGWPLRNFLVFISYYWVNELKEVEILCYRETTKSGVRSVEHSLILTVYLYPYKRRSDYSKCVGWEVNERQKLGPRHVNLGSSMDPVKLAKSAADLNLKLMRWRLLPELDLDYISSQRCLLLGAGTLGCNVARNLLGWGVTNITFVDSAKVSYSNPVRQSLYGFQDCLNGGNVKAEAAAENLRKIYPHVTSRGVNLNIPMPGHFVTENQVEEIKRSVEILETLVAEHDCIFLLLDTRESRWLPTLLGASRGKIVMNSALGFDTFLVLRHGLKSHEGQGEAELHEPTSIPGRDLGCYFCSDIVAPANSSRDRTLDQQCTVARPGMSMIAAALVVELYISLLQHPLKGLAAAETRGPDDLLNPNFTSCLGLIPHQIRGFLSQYNFILPSSKSFPQCTACSPTVVNEYRRKGFQFLLKAFNDPKYLEDLTGLTELHAQINEEDVWCYSDDETE